MSVSKKVSRGLVLSLMIGVGIFSLGKAQSGEVSRSGQEAAFFKDKLITFIVPYGPGGGYDAYARMIAPYLEKETGSTVIVKNVPGGGTLTGTIQMYRAKPDGLTLSILQLSSLVSRTLLGESLGFDLNKICYLPRVGMENRAMFAGGKSAYRTLADMRKASKQITFAAAGVMSSDFNHIAIVAEALNLNVKIVTAYQVSAEQDLATVRGDVEATLGGLPGKLKFVKSGDMFPLLQFGEARDKDIPSIPLGTEVPNLQPNSKELLAFVNHQTAFDRVLAAPPGVEPSRLQFLRDVMMKTLNLPELREIGEKQGRQIIPAAASAVELAVKQDIQMSPDIKELIKQAIKKRQ